MDSRINRFIRGSVSRNDSMESFRDRLRKKRFSSDDIKEAVEIYSKIPKEPERHEKKIMNPFKKFLITIILLIIALSAFYLFVKPTCGNGIIEFGENDLTCCEDAGCMESQICSENRCRNCEDCEYFEDGACHPYLCCISPDCEDGDPETLDICSEGGTKQARCSYLSKQCISDRECKEDEFCEGNRCMPNVKVTPIPFRKGLEMSAKGVSIWKTPSYKEARNDANISGIFLDKAIDDQFIAGTENGWYFGIITDMKSAPRCDRGYIIQKTEEITSFIGMNGERVLPDSKTYIVEAWKLDSEKNTLFFDEHSWRGQIKAGESTRRIEVVAEVGCGSVPSIIGKVWSNESLHLILPDDYGSVQFEFSRVYRIEAVYGKDGSFSLISDAHDISFSS